jgi:hypothetical protein
VPVTDVKYETVGVDPKVPAQAIVTILAFVLTYFGIELDAAVSGALSVVIGAVAARFAPAPKTVAVPAS